MNKAFAKAKFKGAEARATGQSRNMCPYPDHRGGYHEMATWSRAFQRYWRDGWDETDAVLTNTSLHGKEREQALALARGETCS